MSAIITFSPNTQIKSADVNTNFASVIAGSAGFAFDKCRAYMSAGQTISNSTATTVAFDSESYDTNSMHSTSVNTDRFTAQKTGYYLIASQVRWITNATGNRKSWVEVNGSGSVLYAQSEILGSASFGLRNTSTDIVFLTAADYVQLWVSQSSGGNLGIDTSSSDQTWFAISLIA